LSKRQSFTGAPVANVSVYVLSAGVDEMAAAVVRRSVQVAKELAEHMDRPFQFGTTLVRPVTNVTSLFAQQNALTGSHSILFEFIERPANSKPITFSTFAISKAAQHPEQIRVSLLHDNRLLQFIQSAQKQWPSAERPDRERVQHAVKHILSVCGGDAVCDETKTTDSMYHLMEKTELPFVMIGDAINGNFCLGCRYRAMLFKIIGDHSTQFPSEWANAPLQGVELRRALLTQVHEGKRSHLYNVVGIGEKAFVVDFCSKPTIIEQSAAEYERERMCVPFSLHTTALSTDHGAVFGGSLFLGERSALRIVAPPTPKPQTFEGQLIPYNLELGDFDVKQIVTAINKDSTNEAATAGLSIVPMPPVSMEELSRRFARDSFLAFGDHVADGFCWKASSKESICFDAAVDNDLAQCTMYARNLLRMHVGATKRAMVLAKFVTMKFGIPAATPEKVHNLIGAICSETRSDVVLIGRLLTESVGLPVHRALLFKYLADMTVANPVLWSSARSKPEAIQCSIQIDPLPTPPTKGSTIPGIGVVVTIMADGAPFLCDLSGNIVKLSSASGKEMVESKSLFPTTGITTTPASAPADGQGLRVSYSDLTEYSALRPGMGNARLKGRVATAMTSVAGKLYDTARFVSEMEALAGAPHYHFARVLGISYYDVGPTSPPTSPQLGQKEGSTVPQLIALFELLHGPTLADTLRRSDWSAAIDDRVRGCLQLAQALSHLHGLSIAYGCLAPGNIRVDERSFDVKLSGLELSRYALRSAVPQQVSTDDTIAKLEAEESARVNAAFWAPEKFADPQTVTFQTDVYAFGVVLFAVLSHSLPFEGMTFEAIRTAVREGRRPAFDRSRSSAVPAELIRLSTECMADRPNDRPTINDCVDRLRACVDLKTLLRVTGDMQWSTNPNANPTLRATAATGALPKPVSVAPVNVPEPVTAASEAAAESKAKLMVEAMSNPLQPLNPQYGDGPTVEQCDAAREVALSKLGVIDKKMLVGEHVATCALYIIHRTHSGNVALVTRGLSDPSNDSPGTTGLGVELLAEAKEADVGTGSVLGGSFLFQIMHEVAGNCRQFGLKLRQLIDVHGLVSMELNNVDAPPMFTDPHTNRTCVLLGIPSPDVAESFLMPGNLKVRIVTVRLLTFEECIVIRRFGAAGRKAICELFARDGTHHISSIKQPPRPPLDMDIREIKTNVLGSTEALLLTGGGRVVVEAVRAAPKPSEDTVWDAEKVHKRFVELEVKAGGPAKAPVATASASMATAAIPTLTAGGAVAMGAVVSMPAMQLGALPPIDERAGRCELDVKATFPQFARSTTISSAMSRFDMRIRQIIGCANHPAQALAKHVNNMLSTQTQLAGWKHVQDYIVDPKAYLDRIKPVRTSEQVARMHAITQQEQEQPRAIDILQSTAERLLRRLMMRLEWLLDLQTRAKEEFDPDLFLQVMNMDSKWMDESTAFIREAELKVTDLLKRNSQRFGAFRDLQKRGVQWPHSPRLRKDIESAGFVFKPMMVKRDRCVCEQCGIEICGWRPWHNPWQMHNLSKHSADFHERVSRFGTAFPQTGLYTFTIGPANGTAAKAPTVTPAAAQAPTSSGGPGPGK
jgi:serine/threonine protein kinase